MLLSIFLERLPVGRGNVMAQIEFAESVNWCLLRIKITVGFYFGFRVIVLPWNNFVWSMRNWNMLHYVSRFPLNFVQLRLLLLSIRNIVQLVLHIIVRVHVRVRRGRHDVNWPLWIQGGDFLVFDFYLLMRLVLEVTFGRIAVALVIANGLERVDRLVSGHVIFQSHVTVGISRVVLQSPIRTFLVLHERAANLVALQLYLLQAHLQLLVPLFVCNCLLNVFGGLVVVGLEYLRESRWIHLSFCWLPNKFW